MILVHFIILCAAIWAGGTLLCWLPSLPAVHDLLTMPWDGDNE
jgi:hypothetical protein